MFHWKSEALQGYSYGDIIISASTLGAARQKAREKFTVWLKENREWLFFEGDEDTLAEYIKRFDCDLAKDPITTDCIILEGGE